MFPFLLLVQEGVERDGLDGGMIRRRAPLAPLLLLLTTTTLLHGGQSCCPPSRRRRRRGGRDVPPRRRRRLLCRCCRRCIVPRSVLSRHARRRYPLITVLVGQCRGRPPHPELGGGAEDAGRRGLRSPTGRVPQIHFRELLLPQFGVRLRRLAFAEVRSAARLGGGGDEGEPIAGGAPTFSEGLHGLERCGRGWWWRYGGGCGGCGGVADGGSFLRLYMLLLL